MADLDIVRQRGFKPYVIVDSLGKAIAGTKTVSNILSMGLQALCQVNGNGVAIDDGVTTVDTLRQRGIGAFCRVIEDGSDPVTGLTYNQLLQRAILPLIDVDTVGVTNVGTLNNVQLQQRGLRSICPLDENLIYRPLAGTWLPTANGTSAVNGTLPTVYADFTNANHYWYNGNRYLSFAEFLAGIGGTFSRAGNAMMYDSTGKLTYAPNNQALQSQAFNNATWTNIALLSVTDNAATDPNGGNTASSLIPNAANSTHKISQAISLSSATQIFSFYAKANGYARIGFREDGITGNYAVFDLTGAGTVVSFSGVTASISFVSNGWYRCSLYFSASSGGNVFAIYVLNNTFTGNPNGTGYAGDGTSGIFLWGAQVEVVTYQTTPSTYVATIAAAYYGPRFDYDPVALTAKGILLEGSRTNLALQSNAFGTSWTLSSVAITLASAAGVSPDNTTNAWALTEATVTSTVHTVTQAFTKAASALAYSFAVYAKVGVNRTRIELQLNDNAGNGAFSVFDLSGGQIGVAATGIGVAFTALSSTITSVGNGWYRCELRATSNVAVALNALMGIDSGTGVGARSNSYAGVVNDTILAYGAQLEQAAFASSYIPTTTASVTGAQDALATGLASQATGSVYYRVAIEGILANGVGVGGNAEAYIMIDSTNHALIWNGLTGLNSSNTVAENVFGKAMTAWDSSGREICLNGGAVATDAAVQTGSGNYQIGNYNTTDQPIYGWISEIGIWNGLKASGSELQRFTT